MGGLSYAGAVEGLLPHLYSEGSSLDVRVLGGKVYTVFSGVTSVVFGLVIGLIIRQKR